LLIPQRRQMLIQPQPQQQLQHSGFGTMFFRRAKTGKRHTGLQLSSLGRHDQKQSFEIGEFSSCYV
jgi:hypothetical protein